MFTRITQRTSQKNTLLPQKQSGKQSTEDIKKLKNSYGSTVKGVRQKKPYTRVCGVSPIEQRCKCGQKWLEVQPACYRCPICGRRSRIEGTDSQVWLQVCADEQESSLDATAEQIQQTRPIGNGRIEKYPDGPTKKFLESYKRRQRDEPVTEGELFLLDMSERQRKKVAHERSIKSWKTRKRNKRLKKKGAVK